MDEGEYSPRQIASLHEILRVVVGSQLHGLNIPDQDDTDLMGVAIEPPWAAVGLGSFEHWQHRTQPEGVRSGPGDIDLTIYSLRKYIRLAVKGNPTILLPLFAPPSAVRYTTPWGQRLREMAPEIVSQEAGRRFYGYLSAQLDRMDGKGKRNRVPKRPELIARYGYDVKYAAHALRLAFQGLELMRTGRLELPMPDAARETCLVVRRGEVKQEIARMWITGLRLELATLLDNRASDLPLCPNMDSVNDFLIDAHLGYWRDGGY